MFSIIRQLFSNQNRLETDLEPKAVDLNNNDDQLELFQTSDSFVNPIDKVSDDRTADCSANNIIINHNSITSPVETKDIDIRNKDEQHYKKEHTDIDKIVEGKSPIKIQRQTNAKKSISDSSAADRYKTVAEKIKPIGNFCSYEAEKTAAWFLGPKARSRLKSME